MKRGLAVTTALFLLCPMFANAVDLDSQQINFAKVVGSYSDSAWVATNTKTGDIMVVWLEGTITDPWESKVLAALFKSDAKGKFKKGKTRLLYKSESLETPCVAYSEESNSYFAVWGEEDMQSGDRDVLGRRLDSAGRIKNPVVVIRSGTDYDDSNPLVVALPTAVGAPAGARSFLLIWHGREADWLNNKYVESGIFTCNLDAEGNQLSAPNLALVAASWAIKYGDLSRIYPQDVERLPVDGVIVSAHEFVLDNTTAVENQAVFMTLDGGGGRVFYRTEDFDGYPDTRVISMSPTLNIGSFSTKGNPYNRRMKANLKPLGKAYKSSSKSISSNDLVKLGADKGAYQIHIVSEGLRGRYIKGTGKFKGIEQALLDRDDLQVVRAEAIPGTNRIFAVIQYGGFLEANLMAFIFTAK